MKIVMLHRLQGKPECARGSAGYGQGIKHMIPDTEIILLPMADGGEGIVRALVEATRGQILVNEVARPLDERVTAEWSL